MFRELYIKWKVWRGKAADIWSSGTYPSNVLSNLCSNSFCLDGVFCQSMEGFLQSLKYEDINRQRQICAMKGRKAKTKSTSSWQTDQVVWWMGKSIDRQGCMYQRLIRRAYRALFEQNGRFRAALMSTRGMCLYHSRGSQDKYRSILTETEFTSILMEMRDAYRTGEKKYTKRLFFDLDSVCASFGKGAVLSDDETADAFRRLSGHYDCYLLSALPHDEFPVWSAKMSWVKERLGDEYLEKMVATSCKGICMGDILIEAGYTGGASEFEGERVVCASERFPDWNAILKHLLPKENIQ